MSTEERQSFLDRIKCDVPPLPKETLERYSNPQRSNNSTLNEGDRERDFADTRGDSFKMGSNEHTASSQTTDQENGSASNDKSAEGSQDSNGSGMGSDSNGQDAGMDM